MKRALAVAAVAILASPLAMMAAGGPLGELRARKGSVSGAYVEARTAEVFTGGCIMNSEAETMGKQAVLAWKVDRGTFNGINVDGLSVVAAISGDRNLGMTEMGGDTPVVHSALYVDQTANPAQRLALVAMANELSKGIVGTIVQVTPAPITFADRGGEIEVATGPVVLNVSKHMTHDPTCGAQQWFHPLASIDDAALGLTAQHSFTGSSLGTKWSDPNRRSSFFGTFRY